MSEVKEKILIVDDNITDKEELKKILEDEYEILEAGNDELVMQLLEDNLGSIALVIINLEMQEMDASGLLELLKGRNRFDNPVVMIITSQTEAEKETKLPIFDYFFDAETETYIVYITTFRYAGDMTDNKNSRVKITNPAAFDGAYTID